MPDYFQLTQTVIGKMRVADVTTGGVRADHRLLVYGGLSDLCRDGRRRDG